MSAITVDELQRRITRDTRQWGTPFDQRKKTLTRVTEDPRLTICTNCEGEQGYINIFGFYTGCQTCGGRGVVRKHWWTFWVPLPLSFYEE